MKADGKGIKTIMRELELAKETVRRFYRAGSVEELLAKPRVGRPSVLDAYKPYLHERWNAGITNVAQLTDGAWSPPPDLPRRISSPYRG